MKILKYEKYQLLALLIFNVGLARDDGIESRVDNYLSPLITGKNFSGSILIDYNNEIVLSKGYGLANIPFGIENSSQTKFHIASVSKNFTATAILLLNEKGAINLNDFAIKYIPDLRNFKNVTIHQLLNHHSGIPDINRQPGYRELLQNNQTSSTLINIIKEFEPVFEPGAKYSYSNSNYNILARIIEVASGQDYGTFLHNQLFVPLELANTRHHEHMGQVIENLADGYVPAGGYSSLEKAPYVDWLAKTGNGSLYSTKEDLLKWITALMKGRVLSEASRRTMLTEGYGWFVRDKIGEQAIYYNGNSPGFNSYLGHFPKRNLTIIVLGNIDIPLATTIGEGLAALVLEKEVDGFEDLKPIAIDQKFIRSLKGTYKFPWYSFEIIARNDRLVYKGGYPYYEVSMIPVSKSKLFNRFFWTNLIIERDVNGNVTHVYWEGNPQQKGAKIN